MSVTSYKQTQDMREGKSRLDHTKIATRFVANSCDAMVEDVETMISYLAVNDLAVAHAGLTVVIQRAAKLQAIIQKAIDAK